MPLDLTALDSATGRLSEALQLFGSDRVSHDEQLRPHIRAAVILAFACTYEVCIRTLRRHLIATEPDPSLVDHATFNELIRLAWTRGLLAADLAQWQQFRRDRGATSHTYDERTAEEVFGSAPLLLAEARSLADRLERIEAG